MRTWEEIFEKVVKSFRDDIISKEGFQFIPVTDAKAAINFAIKEAWNEAILKAANDAEAIGGFNTGFSGCAASVDKQTILKNLIP